MKKMRNDYVVDVSSVSSPKNLTLADLAKTVKNWDTELRSAKSNNFWGSQGLCMDDAMAYIMGVQTTLENQREQYCMFLDVLIEFHEGRVQVERVVATVKEILKGHTDSICEFNAFLPKELEITVEDKKAEEIQGAMAFVRNVKQRFQSEHYISFLEILAKYQMDESSAHEVFNEVIALFDGHQDLIEEFTTFFSS